jgi:hypothetical protein
MPAPLRTKVKVEFAELVRPNGYWPQPYSLEQAFQVYRWIVKTGKRFSEYQRRGVYDLLTGCGSVGNTDLYYDPIRSIEMLRKRFQFAILGRSNCKAAEEWRAKEKIAFGQERILHFPHYAPFVGSPVLGQVLSEAQIKNLLDAYFATTGNLIVQLNQFHPDAVEIVEMVLRVDTCRFEFQFGLQYGYDGSSWWHQLASGVQFLDTLGLALVEFQRISGKNLLDSIGR